MRDSDLDVIRALPLFAEMNLANFDQLMQNAYFQRFPPHVQLITEGDPADFLYIVTEGAVELFSQANGRETTMAIVTPVSGFILAATLKDVVCLMSARTSVKSCLLLIPSAAIRAMFLRDPAFARSMVVELATAYRSMVKALKEQKLRSSVERLANYLLRQRREHGDASGFDLDIDKRTLAALLGMTPENLSRAFAALKAQGVQVEGRKIRLTAPATLQAFAAPTPLIDDRDS